MRAGIVRVEVTIEDKKRLEGSQTERQREKMSPSLSPVAVWWRCGEKDDRMSLPQSQSQSLSRRSQVSSAQEGEDTSGYNREQ